MIKKFVVCRFLKVCVAFNISGHLMIHIICINTCSMAMADEWMHPSQSGTYFHSSSLVQSNFTASFREQIFWHVLQHCTANLNSIHWLNGRCNSTVLNNKLFSFSFFVISFWKASGSASHHALSLFCKNRGTCSGDLNSSSEVEGA